MIDISFSQVSVFLQCPRKWQFSRQDIKTSRNAALVYGSVFHSALAESLGGQPLNVWKHIAPYLDGSAKESNWNGKIDYSAKDEQPASMIPWLEEAAKLILARDTRPQATELKLVREFPDFRLTGIIDALWGGHLVDFKLVGRYYKPDLLQAAVYAILNGGVSSFQFYAVYKEKLPRLDVLPVKQTKNKAYLSWVVDNVLTPAAKSMQSGHCPANPSHQFCSEAFCQYWAMCVGGLK